MSACVRIVLRAFLLFVVAMPVYASASTLSFGGVSNGTVGSVLAIPVVVSSSDTSINAISAEVSFPADILTLKSITKGTLINFWTKEPSFDASTASLEGVVFNPGWTGSKATVATLVFVPKKAGNASISFAHASVLANDGQGTETITDSSPKTVVIAAALPTPPAPKIEAPVAATTTTTTTATTTAPVYGAPTVSSFTRVIDAEHPLVIAGTAPPGAQVEILLSSCIEAMAHTGLSAAADCGAATSRSTAAGSDGVYVLVWDGDIPAGTYSFTVRAFVDGGVTAASKEQTIVVQEAGHRTATLLFLDNVALVFVALLALAGFVVLSLTLAWFIRQMWYGMFKRRTRVYPMPEVHALPHETTTPVLASAVGSEPALDAAPVPAAAPATPATPETDSPYVTRLTWKR